MSILNDTAFLSRDASTFYDPRFFNDVFHNCKADAYMPTGNLLAAHGSFLAETWMSEMASIANHPFNQEFFEDVDTIFEDMMNVPNLPHDPENLRLSTPIQELSDDILSELLIRPVKLAHIKTIAESNHIVNMKHFLRASSEKHSEANCDCGENFKIPNNQLDPDKTFAILLDTGCSVSCSGFAEDFHGELAYGDFGTVKTADGMANIEGFGILRWDCIDVDGHRITIMVPGYYSPTVKLRLLSPQDYCRYHKMPIDVPQYSGNAGWMTMNIKHDSKATCMVAAPIDMHSRLPFLLGELGHHDVKDRKETRCHCHVASIFDVRNVNLTEAQKRLKLDHDRLGHLSMQAIQRLYQPDEADKPDFDGVSVSSNPCLVAKDSAQLRCTPPVCEACQVAKARRRPTGATKVSPVPDVVDGIRAEDVKLW